MVLVCARDGGVRRSRRVGLSWKAAEVKSESSGN